MVNSQDLAQNVVRKMLDKDAFSEWLGIKVVELAPGYSKIEMKVRDEMVNGFDVCHGGVTFSFADSAFAFAANSHGRLSLALDANISFPAPVKNGDLLQAEAKEYSKSNRVACYEVIVSKIGNSVSKANNSDNQDSEIVGLFRGTVYRTGKEFFPESVAI